jgi:hypothetical protein
MVEQALRSKSSIQMLVLRQVLVTKYHKESPSDGHPCARHGSCAFVIHCRVKGRTLVKVERLRRPMRGCLCCCLLAALASFVDNNAILNVTKTQNSDLLKEP